MALQAILGSGPQQPPVPNHAAFNGLTTGLLIDATGEKIALVGRVWFPARTGTKSIERILIRFGSVTKAGGSALTISLQDVDATTGPPSRPDETQDQTVAVANADATFATNTWHRSGTLSANRSVSCGDLIAVVIEYDGAGRLGSDSVIVSSIGASAQYEPSIGGCVLKTGGTWARVATALPNVLFEMSDGTFGSLDGGYGYSGVRSITYNSGSASDEYALKFSFPVSVEIDQMWAWVSVGGGSADYDIVLYEGTTALNTVSFDASMAPVASSTRLVCAPITKRTLTANTDYYVSVKPTTANSLTVYAVDVSDANHLSALPGGVDFTYATRADAGAWSETTTAQLMAGVRISAIDDGAGSGGIKSNRGMTGGMY